MNIASIMLDVCSCWYFGSHRVSSQTAHDFSLGTVILKVKARQMQALIEVKCTSALSKPAILFVSNEGLFSTGTVLILWAQQAQQPKHHQHHRLFQQNSVKQAAALEHSDCRDCRAGAQKSLRAASVLQGLAVREHTRTIQSRPRP